MLLSYNINYLIPSLFVYLQREEAEWVGLSIQEALEKAETQISQQPVVPLKQSLESRLRKTYRRK